MADDSLIDEMRATIRGDRERAEQRRSAEEPTAWALQAAPPPEETAPADDARQPEDEAVPAEPQRRSGWLARLRLGRDR